MSFSRRKFETGELVKLTESFQEERKLDSNVLKCKIGIILSFKKSFIISICVSGFRDKPTFLLKLLICLIVSPKFSVASGWIVIMSAPASAKFFIYL